MTSPSISLSNKLSAHKAWYIRNLLPTGHLWRFHLGPVAETLADRVLARRRVLISKIVLTERERDVLLCFFLFTQESGSSSPETGPHDVDKISCHLEYLFGKRVCLLYHFSNMPDAKIVADLCAIQLLVTRSIQKVLTWAEDHVNDWGLSGLTLQISGRPSGAAIAERRSSSVGRRQLRSIHLPVDYYKRTVNTKFGTTTIQVWTYRQP